MRLVTPAPPTCRPADLLTEISRGVDKQLWFFEAHTQEPSGMFRN